MHQAAKVPGPGNYDVDMYSIGRRTGAVTPLAGSVPPSKPNTAHSAGIPPEARRKPKPKVSAEEAAGEAPSGPRPHTSLGFAEKGTKILSTEASLPQRDKMKSSSGAVWYKRGVSREGSGLRAMTPGSWILPESAQRAYGVWNPRGNSPKKQKRRQTADQAKPVVIKVHVDSGNPPMGAGGDYDIEVFEDPAEAVQADSLNKTGGASQGAEETKRGDLTQNAQKLFDLAMESDEFRRMMQVTRIPLRFWLSVLSVPPSLPPSFWSFHAPSNRHACLQLYTGMDDPTAVIQNYAEMWAKQPLVVTTPKRGRKSQTPTGSSERRRPAPEAK
jgi:hypothetical protein